MCDGYALRTTQWHATASRRSRAGHDLVLSYVREFNARSTKSRLCVSPAVVHFSVTELQTSGTSSACHESHHTFSVHRLLPLLPPKFPAHLPLSPTTSMQDQSISLHPCQSPWLFSWCMMFIIAPTP